MLIKTRGIVFRTRKYSETSVISDIYTEAKGLRTYIASGVRTQKARISAGLLQVMSLVDIVAYHRDDQAMTRLKEIKAAYVFHNIPFDIRREAVGMFMIELARNTIHGHEEYPDLFDFLFENFAYLDETPHPVSNLHLHFALHLCSFMGFMPGEFYSEASPFFDLQEGVFVEQTPHHPHWIGPELAEKMSLLLDATKETCHAIAMNRQERKVLLKSLLEFYRLHIEHFPAMHSHEILEVVLAE